MPPKRKDGKVINAKIRTEVYNKLDDYCNEVGQSKTTAIERILNSYFNEYYGKEEDIRKPV